jgi:hypothetical protein
MLTRAEDLRTNELNGRFPAPVESPPSRRATTRSALLVFVVSLSSLLAIASPSAAQDDPFAFDQVLPESFQYVDMHESMPPSFSFKRNESRAVQAPTRYRTTSILKYSRALGDTGMILRIKLPLNRRKIIKFELRF